MRHHSTASHTHPASPPQEALDKTDIAGLSTAIVEQLTPEELRRLIEASGHPWRTELQDLQYADPGVTRRLAYLARLCCQNQQCRYPDCDCVERAQPEPACDSGCTDCHCVHTETRPMLHCLQIPETNIIELTVDGSVSEEEFDDILDILEDTIQEYGSIRVLKIIHSLGEFPTIPFSRVWDDVRFGLQHFSHVSRAAVVSDLPWLEKMIQVVQPLLKAQIRWFPESQLEAARAWLRGD